MVKMLTDTDQQMIDAAIKEAERNTSATIRVVVRPASDRYQEFVLLYGLIFGSALNLGLWAYEVLDSYPWLLAVQFAIMVVVEVTPCFRKLCVRLIPGRILRHHAARMGFQEYHVHHVHAAADAPFVLLFVSLAEHYVHVITNPALHQQLPDNWDAVVTTFVTAMRKDGTASACVQAVAHIGERLKSASV